MSLNRRNPRRDANELPIVQALKQIGASVARISEPGMPDLIVWYRGSITLLEIKRPKAVGQAAGRATLAQIQRTAEGWPIVTARTVDEALKAVQPSFVPLHICKQPGFNGSLHRCLGCHPEVR